MERPVHRSDPARSVEADFVENWGLLAQAFGMPGDLGRVHALIYIAEHPTNEKAIAAELGFSLDETRHHVRELLNWGVVRSSGSPGLQRLVTERDPWEFFLQIVAERHRREFLPVLARMRATLTAAKELRGPSTREVGTRQRVESFTGFVEELSRLIDLFVRVGSKPMALVLKTMAKLAPRTRR